jgi:hypothetical protein
MSPERRAVLLLALIAAFAPAGCPMRDLGVSITSGGAQDVLNACTSTCRRDDDGGVPFQIGRGTVFDTTCACEVTGNPWPDWTRELQARLFVVAPGESFAVKDASLCMSIAPCGEGGVSRSSKCIAERINQQLDGAMPKGVTSDGLRNADDVILVLALYQPAAGSDASCGADALFACAGMSTPLGGGNYDISCASCQGGSRTPSGSDTGPCPRLGNDKCFVQSCYAFLKTAAM